MSDCVLSAQSEHFQVPAGLHLSDERRLVFVLRPLPSGGGTTLGVLGAAAMGLRSAERGHRLFAVPVMRRVSNARTADTSSTAPGC